MSSENRSIKPQALDNEVPPLKVIFPFNSGTSFNKLSVQHTQKSFSIVPTPYKLDKFPKTV